MSFLAPLFFLGLGAVAVPILVHLIQRERSRLVQFPSLMFVRRIPYQSVRRRKIRHWYLLAMRIGALALIVAAFTRPFLNQNAAAAVIGAGGNRELVILLDQSASMAYGDHWTRAQAAARDAARSLVGADRATLVVFGRSAEEHVRATADVGRLEAAIDSTSVTSGSTRYGPALKLAESILTQSTMPAREVVLISDFQRSGWVGSEDVQFPDDIRVTPVPIRTDGTHNLSIPSASFARAPFSGQERVTATAGVSNRGLAPATNVPVSLEVDGLQVETQRVTIAPDASMSVSFAPFTLATEGVRGAIRAGSDDLAIDNSFYFVLAPSQPLSVLIVDSGSDSDSTFYLSRALEIGNAPAFQVDRVSATRLTPALLDAHAVVVMNDAAPPPGLGASGLQGFVERGGGLLVALGERGSWPAADSTILPGQPGPPVDRLGGRVGSIGYIDYSHPVFEIFKAPRSGDFSVARILRYRSLQVPPEATVLARFDDGSVAVAEKRIGTGRVVVMTTPLDDSWTDLPLKPVYLPLLHRLIQYLARYESPTAWQTVGQVVNLETVMSGSSEHVVVTPSNEQIKVSPDAPELLELDEQGIYEVRSASTSSPPYRVAVNIDSSESDLSPFDPDELVAAVTGRAGPATTFAAAQAELSPEDAEGQQSLWWFLLIAGLALLTAETVVANRLSRHERFQ